MYLSSTALMVLIEVIVVLLAGCGFLYLHNRRMRGLSSRLQERMAELVENLRQSRAEATGTTTITRVAENYRDALEKQMALTREYHRELGSGEDIAMDLDGSTPMQRRVAALRYAVLIAERDAQGEKTDQEPDWDKLSERYRHLMEFYAANDDSDLAELSADASDLEALQQELLSYKKRVVNLEKFKTLYFELEKRWEASTKKARTHYDELSEFSAQVDDPDSFDQALQGYQAAFQGIAELVEQDPATLVTSSASARAAQQATGEIRHLRNVAADQHRLIFELQQRLAAASTQDEASEAITALQEELTKQMRYVQESETCIQLLEDELTNAHQEAEQSRTRLQQFGLLKAEYKELQSTNSSQEKLIFALKNETQRLKNKIRSLSQSGADNSAQDLKKELAQQKVRYAELEERYLELKMAEN